MPSVLLIHPPVAKASEPPGGIAALAGALEKAGVECAVLDGNLEGLEGLIRSAAGGEDAWSRRALRDRERNLKSIRQSAIYAAPDRYVRVVADLNRLLGNSAPLCPDAPIRISLANYQDHELAPTRSQDLLQAARQPERNPFTAILEPVITRAMERLQPAAVGFSLNYLSQALCTFALIGFVRRNWPGVRILLGGGLVTSWAGRLPGEGGGRPGARPSQRTGPDCAPKPKPQSHLAGDLSTPHENSFGGLVDILIPGPGEARLLQLLGADSPGKVAHSLPDYSRFPLDAYFSPGRILPYAASRGCYWNRCAFCPEPAEGNRFLPVGRSRVVEDLRLLADRYHPVLVHLVDNALSPALLDALIRMPPGPPWYGFVRFSHRLADLAYCRLLRQAGCVMLKLGLESGSQSVLDQEGKGVDLVLAEQVLKNLKAAGIASYVYLLFGTPSESECEARATLEYTVRLHNEIDFLNVALFNLPITGRIRQDLEIMPHTDDLSLYTAFRHPKGWDRRMVRRFLDREFRRHPAIAAILRRDPLLFTSNHAPFFVPSRPAGQGSSG